jgi:lysozyme
MSDSTETETIAVNMAKGFEGFRAGPYPDPASGGEPWTIGYGSTRDAQGNPVTPTTAPVTEAQATALAERDMALSFQAVAAVIKAPMTVNETAAVMDFIYNVGAGNFKNSTLLRLINLGQYEAAAKEFEKWDMAAGRVMAGLLRRRVAEEQLFDTPDMPATPPVTTAQPRRA